MPDGIQASLYIWRCGLLRRPFLVPLEVPDTDKREARKTPSTSEGLKNHASQVAPIN